MAKKKLPQAGIYRIHCGPYFYIGSTSDFEKRRQHHRWVLANGRHCNRKIQAAFNEHGSMSFERLRLTDLVEDLRAEEMEILNLYAADPFLCNINSNTFGPDEAMKERARDRMADRETSAPTRAKMADAKRGARNAKARAVIVTDPDGVEIEFPCVSDVAKFFGVSQQLMDQWIRGVVAWPGKGYRVRKENAWIAAYSAKVVEKAMT